MQDFLKVTHIIDDGQNPIKSTESVVTQVNRNNITHIDAYEWPDAPVKSVIHFRGGGYIFVADKLNDGYQSYGGGIFDDGILIKINKELRAKGYHAGQTAFHNDLPLTPPMYGSYPEGLGWQEGWLAAEREFEKARVARNKCVANTTLWRRLCERLALSLK